MPRATRTALLTLSLSLIAGAPAVLMTGCKSPAPGVKATPFGIKQSIPATPAEIADAAEGIFADLGLRDVESHSTGLDSLTTGMSALGKDVKVSAKSENTGVSQVYVNSSVGQGNAVEILRRINNEVGHSFQVMDEPADDSSSSSSQSSSSQSSSNPSAGSAGSERVPSGSRSGDAASTPRTTQTQTQQPDDSVGSFGNAAAPEDSATGNPRRSLDSVRGEMEQNLKDGANRAGELSPEAVREQRVIPEK